MGPRPFQRDRLRVAGALTPGAVGRDAGADAVELTRLVLIGEPELHLVLPGHLPRHANRFIGNRPPIVGRPAEIRLVEILRRVLVVVVVHHAGVDDLVSIGGKEPQLVPADRASKSGIDVGDVVNLHDVGDASGHQRRAEVARRPRAVREVAEDDAAEPVAAVLGDHVDVQAGERHLR